MELLSNFLENTNKTLLCAGPVSQNIIEVAIEFAEKHNSLPFVLVPSRRQIDCKSFGGGYVNNWSTEEFSAAIQSRQIKNIILERDHGGPFQGSHELKHGLNVSESMQAAKKSFEADIDSGFQILHIDPTIPIGNERLDTITIMKRLFELYGHISDYAQSRGKKIYIEVGTEEQNGSYPDLKEFEFFLNSLCNFTQKNGFAKPLFVVLQTGTKVLENKNIGISEIGSQFDKNHLMKTIQEAFEISKKYQIHIKEHNTDYLSFDNLCLRPYLGIRASNVAPEFGYFESKTFINLLRQFGSANDVEELISLVDNSKKWEKWVYPESNLKKIEKAQLAAHYSYSNPQFIQIRDHLKFELNKRNISLDEILKNSIRSIIYKYALAFGLI